LVEDKNIREILHNPPKKKKKRIENKKNKNKMLMNTLIVVNLVHTHQQFHSIASTRVQKHSVDESSNAGIKRLGCRL